MQIGIFPEQALSNVKSPANGAFSKTRDMLSEKNALEMVLFQVLLVCPFSVAAVLLVFTATMIIGAAGFQGYFGGWE